MKKSIFKQAILALFLLASIMTSASLQAQNGMKGKDFWLTFGNNDNYAATDLMLQLKVASERNATVTLQFSANGSTYSTSVTANTVKTIDLQSAGGDKRSLVYNDVSGVTAKSVHITATDSVVIYAFNQQLASSDATAVLPTSGLGTNYFHAGYRPVIPTTGYAADSQDGYAVVATENGTKIYENSTASTPLATLNAGQVYTFYGNAGGDGVMNPAGLDLTGKHIVADKPVAYFTVNSSAGVPATYRFSDNLYEQLFPVDKWGREFFVPNTLQTKMRVRIIAAANGTNINIPGIVTNTAPTGSVLFNQTGIMGPIVTEPANPNASTTSNSPITGNRPTGGKSSLTGLNEGQFVEIDVASAANGCYIKADKPVMVVAYMVGAGRAGAFETHSYTTPAMKGDPSIAWIPPMEQCTRNVMVSRASFKPSSDDVGAFIPAHYALIVTETATKNQTTIKSSGSTVTLNSGWKDKGGLSFASYQLTTDNTYIIDNPNGVVVGAYGWRMVESYYYMGGSAVKNTFPSLEVNGEYYEDMDGKEYGNCDEMTFECLTQGIAATSVEWDLNGVRQTAHSGELLWSTHLPNDDYTLTMTVEMQGSVHVRTTHFKVSGCAPAAPPVFRWWYISSPYSDGNPRTFITAADTLGGKNGSMLGYYDEGQKKYTEPFTISNFADNKYFEAGRGIVVSLDTNMVAFNPPTAATFANANYGKTQNAGDITVAVTNTTTGAANQQSKKGQNLAGNPYLSYIDFDKFYADNSGVIRNTLWVRGLNKQEMKMKYDTYNVGGTGTATINGTALNGHIPPVQGFWIHAMQSGNVTFKETHKIPADASQILRAAQKKDNRILRLKVSSGIYSDETIIVFNPAASDGYDMFDSEKISNDDKDIPELYTTAVETDNYPSLQLAINGMSPVQSEKSIPLGFRTGRQGNFTISAKFESWNDVQVLLRDNTTGEETDLSKNAYGFASNIYNNTARFTLIFKAKENTTDVNNPANNNNVVVYVNDNNRIVVLVETQGIASLQPQPATAQVFNVTGQKLHEETIHSTFCILHSTFPSGVYLVKVGGKTEKVVIK